MSTEEDTTSLESMSLTKRVDVYKGNIFRFVRGETYYARLGFFDQSGLSNRAVFVLEANHLCSTPILESRRLWEDHYLTSDIKELKLEVGDIKHKQMVVSVDRDENKVRRGFFLGARPGKVDCLLYCLDTGSLNELPLSSLYATTELVAYTQFQGFPCVLADIELFTGTKRIFRAMEDMNFKMERMMLCKIICTGFYKKEPTIPVVELWPLRDKMPIHPVTVNRMIADECVKQCMLELQKKYLPGTVIEGTVAHLSGNGKVNLHVAGVEEDDTLAVYMDNYLSKFAIADLQQHFPSLTKELALKGFNDGTVYVAEFEDDRQLYRGRIVEISDDGVVVGFMDYGNMAFVPYGKVFEAELLDKSLAMLPPLVFGASLFGIGKILDTEAASEFLDSHCSEIKVCGGGDSGGDLPVLLMTGRREEGTVFVVNDELLSQGLALPPQ